MADDAGAAAKKQRATRTTVLGAGAPASPTCDGDECFVEARVTGYQIQIGNIKKPFVSPAPGRIVAWSVKLGNPSARVNNCLSNGCDVGGGQRFEGFGGPSRARLSILVRDKSKKRAGKPFYKLLRQAPVETLTEYFGSKSAVTFVLKRPMKIGRGQIAALTIPTWAPVFAGGLSSSDRWRASRRSTKKRGGCTVGDTGQESANVKAGSPHQKVGGTRYFGCVYGGNRLLYSATLVKKPMTKAVKRAFARCKKVSSAKRKSCRNRAYQSWQRS